MSEFTHFDAEGRAHMVDVSEKAVTQRSATAGGTVLMSAETLQRIQAKGFKKGDVLAVAQLAGIMGAKRTADLIPLCHPLGLDGVEVALSAHDGPPRVEITATARVTGRTGVEMEALTAVTTAALTLYDMCKAVDKGMTIENIRLLAKSGGRSGEWKRAEA